MKKTRLLLPITMSILFLFAGTMIFGGCKNTEEVTEEVPAEENVEETTPAEEAPAEEVSETEEASLPYEGQELVISGSTTLLQVSEAWTTEFMKEYGGTIIVNGGGSGAGIADLINGISDLANASRQIKDEELESAKSVGLDIQEYKVLYDGIAIITSDNVSIDDITIEELSKIYTGEITNWKDVGGDDSEIVIIARDSSSGTGEYFLEEVVQLGKTVEDNDYSENALRLQSNAEVVNQVKENDNAIGYIGLGYLEESLNVIKVEGIEPSIDTVKDGSYPISRGLYIYSAGELTGIGEAFIDFVLSERGQEIGLEEGFVPLN
ncbi:MAG: phosphate ABC transporter substrate-binding protein [Actinomycetota bacterium]|nr:phosphate ABC transporter substrate-binding protein [Actinomycetota bacterium]